MTEVMFLILTLCFDLDLPPHKVCRTLVVNRGLFQGREIELW